MDTRVREAELYIYSLLGGDKELADAWWHTPNKAFNGITPSEVWSKNPDLVLDYLKF
jgi:hypothetical protein